MKEIDLARVRRTAGMEEDDDGVIRDPQEEARSIFERMFLEMMRVQRRIRYQADIVHRRQHAPSIAPIPDITFADTTTYKAAHDSPKEYPAGFMPSPVETMKQGPFELTSYLSAGPFDSSSLSLMSNASVRRGSINVTADASARGSRRFSTVGLI